jgi:hypothetical protein
MEADNFFPQQSVAPRTKAKAEASSMALCITEHAA